MKYVIKNCPAIKEITTLLTSEPPQVQNEWRCCTTGSNLKKCENINDCVMKKIYAACKQEIKVNNDDAPTNAYAMGRVVVAEKILDLLEIERCE